jgi:hypothetical protein
MKTKSKQKPKAQTPIERFLALSDAEKDAEVAEFENGVDLSQWRPLTPTERKFWNSVKRKLGRPKIGRGCKTVAVSMEIGLLKRVDKYAKAHSMKRAEMIAEGLRLVLERKTG